MKINPNLTNLEIKEMLLMIKHNHNIIKDFLETYFEVHEKYMNKIMEHLQKIDNE